MLETHFLKRRLGYKKFNTIFQGQIYNAIPENKLLTKGDLVGIIEQIKDLPLKTKKSMEDSIKTMVEDEFLHEFHGVFLEKRLGL